MSTCHHPPTIYRLNVITLPLCHTIQAECHHPPTIPHCIQAECHHPPTIPHCIQAECHHPPIIPHCIQAECHHPPTIPHCIQAECHHPPTIPHCIQVECHHPPTIPHCIQAECPHYYKFDVIILNKLSSQHVCLFFSKMSRSKHLHFVTSLTEYFSTCHLCPMNLPKLTTPCLSCFTLVYKLNQPTK